MMDLINEIVHPDGAYAAEGYYQQVTSRKVLEHGADALRLARAARIPVIHVVVGFSPDYSEWPPRSALFASAHPDAEGRGGRLALGGWGTQIHRAVAPAPGEPVIAKHRVSPFYGTSLELRLRTLGVDSLLLAGLTTDLVVLGTAREAHDRDFAVEVLEDVTATIDEELQAAAIRVIARTAEVTTVARALEATGARP